VAPSYKQQGKRLKYSTQKEYYPPRGRNNQLLNQSKSENVSHYDTNGAASSKAPRQSNQKSSRPNPDTEGLPSGLKKMVEELQINERIFDMSSKIQKTICHQSH